MASEEPSPPVPVPEPIITTPRFMIRPYHEIDIHPMAALLEKSDTARYMRNTFPDPYTLKDAQDWVALVTKPDPPQKAFGIFVPISDSSSPGGGEEVEYTLAGSIGLQPHTDVESKTWNLGYLMGEAYRGKGLMAEATTAFVRWALLERYTETELIRLEGGVFGGNTASIKVLLKAGFKFEGIRRKAVVKKGEVLDMHVFGCLREDLV
ncbi:putative acetyltransferase protein [Rhypophila sp. PSN 637]